MEDWAITMAKKKATRRKRAIRRTKSKGDALPVETQEPPVETQEPPDRYHWPVGVPIPDVYLKVRRQPPPCPECRRVRTDEGGQSSVCQSSGSDVAWFRCKCCGHSWPLPVREVRRGRSTS